MPALPDASSSDDEIYAWFIRSLAPAEEVEPGVIRVWLDSEEGESGENESTVDILMTRAQLRSVAWASVNVFDDTDLQVIPPAKNPVLVGLDLMSYQAEEWLGTMRLGERYLVFDKGTLWPSVRPQLPAERSTRHWFET